MKRSACLPSLLCDKLLNMETKVFGDKKIKIRKISPNDIWKAEKFQEFVNSLIEEDVMISMTKKITVKEEKKYLEDMIKSARNKSKIYIIAEEKGKVVGTTSIRLDSGRKSHIANFGITIRNGYRGIGLGKYLMVEILKLVKKDLEPQPEIIDLRVFSANKPAIGLYEKMGFKIVARIPEHRQYRGELLDEIVMTKHV